MDLVVDTSVWSHCLRRHRFNAHDPYVQALLVHTRADDAVLTIGVILEEILSGVRSDKDFDWVLRALSRVPMIPLGRETYVSAARLRNRCRAQGVQATTVDCPIAAACIEHGCPLLTADRDFLHIARHSDLVLLPPLVWPSPLLWSRQRESWWTAGRERFQKRPNADRFRVHRHAKPK